MHPASQEQSVVLLRKYRGPLFDLVFFFENCTHCLRQVAHVFQTSFFLLFRQQAFFFGNRRGHQEQGCELSGKGFRGSDTDLYTCTSNVMCTSPFHHGARCDIANRHRHVHAQALGMFQRCERISGLS